MLPTSLLNIRRLCLIYKSIIIIVFQPHLLSMPKNVNQQEKTNPYSFVHATARTLLLRSFNVRLPFLHIIRL